MKTRAQGATEEVPHKKVKATDVRGLDKITPLFALACIRQVWEPVSQSSTSAMYDGVKEQQVNNNCTVHIITYR
jgi:hypothetical protein